MSVACFGELLIDFVAQQHDVTVGEAFSFQKAPGGAPANVAVAVARLGCESAFIGQVGDDPFGHFLAEVLDAEGVNISGLRFAAAARTALAFVSLAADGERSFVFYRHPSADMLLRPEEVATHIISDKQIFHFGSITLIGEPSRAATLAAVQAAIAAKALISYDPNLRLALWPDAETARAGMLAGLDYAHILKISDEELEFLTGGHKIDPLWRPQLRLIAITHGARGATLYTPDNQQHVPGFSVKPVDTTGAGDGFVAGMLVGILEQSADYLEHLRDIGRFANAVGALTTTQYGAIPALPSRAAVDAFLKTSA